MRRVFLLMLVLLAACGSSAQVLPTAAPQSPVALEQDEPTPKPIANRVSVPGKLLLVNSGNLVMISGEKTSQLTNSGKKYQPAWSQDGRRIAYIQREESFADLWVMNVDGTQKIRVTANEPDDLPARSKIHVLSIKWAFYPAWSPDGTLLAYISQAQPPSEINDEVALEYPLSLYLYGTHRIGNGTPAGASFQVLVQADTDLLHPTWAPDSSLLVFEQLERQTPDGHRLAFFDYATSNHGLLEGQQRDQFVNAQDPDLSPDGKWLVYIRAVEGGSDIWAVSAPDAAGTVVGTPQQLSADRLLRAPTWSPDGKTLAYFEARANTMYLLISSVEVSGAGKLTLGPPQEVWQGTFDADSGMSWIR